MSEGNFGNKLIELSKDLCQLKQLMIALMLGKHMPKEAIAII